MRTRRTAETGFDDGTAQVRNIRDPRPTANEHQEHKTTHRPCRSWCMFCVMGRGVNSTQRRSGAFVVLEGCVLLWRWRGAEFVWCPCGVDFQKMFLSGLSCAGQQDQVESLAEAAHGRCPELEGEQRSSSTGLGTTESHSGARSQTYLERPPLVEVQWDHRVCGGARGWRGQNTKDCAGTSCRDQSPVRRKDTVLAGGICRILHEQA